MVHTKPALPAGHGEVLTRPPFSEWAGLARANHADAAQRNFQVAGMDARELRSLARREALVVAAEFSAKLGVAIKPAGDPEDLVVMSGHQPEIYHPGVWIKDFLLQRLADELGATAIDAVVDTDAFEAVGVALPCMSGGITRCRENLAVGAEDICFACAPVPSADEIEEFCGTADSMLATLRAPAIRRHFSAFCEQLRGASQVADNLAEFVTIARRRYEAAAGTDYLELPLTWMARTDGWLTFAADIALNAQRFADAYNSELAEYRAVNKTRSAAQPFPDLGRDGDMVELPLWRIADGRRLGVHARNRADGGVDLEDGAGGVLAELPPSGSEAVAVLRASGLVLAPKALALTLFLRLFVADLMIHGVGGGRYDRVTDGVCRLYYGVEAPAYVVASITMYLPLGAHIVSEGEVAAAKERLNRLEHNPDALLGEIDFDSVDEERRALALAEEKARLVADIAAPGADKKQLGARIRANNAELSAVLEPLRRELTSELVSLESQLAASEVLTDRTYPFCFWSPQEVADKAS